MANDNEVKFTANIQDNASPALRKLADNNADLAQAVSKASDAVAELENTQKNASAATEKNTQIQAAAVSSQQEIAETASTAAEANRDLSAANQEFANSSQSAVQMAEQESRAKEKSADSADKLANSQKKAASGTGVLQNALGRLKQGFALDVVIGNLVTKGIDLAIGAFKNLAESVVDCVYKFAEAEMVNARLEASLRNQGITSAYVTKELNDYAQGLQNVYGVSADTVKNGMRLLVNFGVIGDELKSATSSAYALSQGLGIDLQSAFQMVARAAEGNVSALSRYGIKVDASKTQSEQFAQALAQIDAKFGNLAGASANNLITKTNVLKETWDDFKKQVGAAFEPLGQLLVNILTSGVEGLQKGFRFLTDTLNILVESGVQGFNYISLGVLKTQEAVQKLIVKSAELRNAIGLASDETVAAAKANLEATQAEIGRKKEQIELFKQATQYLESDREAIAANSAESRAAGAQQVQAAKDRMQAEQEAAEAKKKADEEAKTRAEQEAQDAENRAKRVSDFKYQTHMGYLDKIAEIEKAQTGYEQAELIARNEQDYEAKRTALENQISYLAEKNSNDINAKKELQDELKALEEEYAAYEDELNQRKENGAISYNALDKFLADQRTQNAMKSLNDISQLQNAKTKELAAVGKAAAIATATVDTYKAANAAYSAMAGIPIVGPALGAAAAAAAVAAGLMNVGKITGIQLAVGTPYVPADMPATVHRGEIIVPRTFSEGLRAGDLALASPEALSGGEGGGQYNVVQNFNFNGDILADSADSIAEKLGQTTSELIAGGRMAPFPTGERM